jgi:Ca2+-binding EF-hand superfamily protein
MPGETSRDPFGANRGKTFRQHADSLSSTLKKRIHDKYYIPPYRPVNRNWEITFASLGWKRRTIQKFWRLFCRINVSLDGAIKLDEFLDFFDLDWTPWTERCFRYFDTTGGGDIDFLEFMISVWNVCTFNIDTLSNFAFDMYDTDEDGELSIPEIETMIEDLYGEKGGRKCLSQITQYAEERGGALSLNSFISFTANHQMLLFPMFLIQQKLQKRVFGRRFWQSIDRKSKENRKGTRNHNDFNPRHVQVLLRTYQTGGAAAVLSHTGDPNKGLRDWYENQKQNDIQDLPADEVPNIERWRSVKNSMVSNQRAQRFISNGATIKRHTLQKMKSLKSQRFRDQNDDIDQVVSASALGFYGNGNDTGGTHEPEPSAPPRELLNQTSRPSSATVASRPSSATVPPPDVADALKRIRARRASNAPVDDKLPMNSRPSSASRTPPRDVAEALKTIRAKRENTPNGDSSPPPEAREALKSIRARRKKSMKADAGGGGQSRKPKHRSRTSNTIPNNVRQRRSGTMFVPANSSDGWLK